MPRIIGLAGNCVSVAKCLIEEAEKNGEKEDHSLVGYRLAQSFADWSGLDRDEQEQMRALMINMEKHPNARVRLLALSRARIVGEGEKGGFCSFDSL